MFVLLSTKSISAILLFLKLQNINYITNKSIEEDPNGIFVNCTNSLNIMLKLKSDHDSARGNKKLKPELSRISGGGSTSAILI